MSGARDAAVITTQATGAPTICRFSATLLLSVSSPTLRQCDDRNAVPTEMRFPSNVTKDTALWDGALLLLAEGK
jgi:hypothetical protein